VKEDVVRTMLGTVDREYAYRIADALAARDGPSLLAESDALAARGLSSPLALDELASLFHRIAVAQVVPEAARAFDDAPRLADYAARFTPETVQLHYQIATQGRADLALAPDEATGVAMTLLRMLAFSPDKTGDPAPRVERAAPAPVSRQVATPGPGVAAVIPAATRAAQGALPRDVVALPADVADWPAFVAGLKLTGMAAQLAAQTELKSIAGNALTLALPAAFKHLADKAYSDKLKVGLEQATGRKLLLAFEVGAPADSSLAATEKRERAEANRKREAAFREEPFVRDLLARFDGQVKSDTIKPANE